MWPGANFSSEARFAKIFIQRKPHRIWQRDEDMRLPMRIYSLYRMANFFCSSIVFWKLDSG